MRKKQFIGLLAAMMGMALALPVYAKGETTDLTAEVASSYTLTIPQKTTIPYGSESAALEGVLKVSGNVKPGETVEVTADAKPLVRDGGTDILSYTLKNGTDDFLKTVWDETQLRDGLAGPDAGKKLTLSVAIGKTVWEKAKAGTYNGGIVFTAELK